MRELLRSNDLALLSAVRAALTGARIPFVEFDDHTASLYGNIGAVERRLMVDDDDLAAARQVVAVYGPEHLPPEPV